jgi:hypothetical protein
MTSVALPRAAGRIDAGDAARAAHRGVIAAVATLAWGALSFGAVYEWGYWPLAIACQVCGFAGLLIDREQTRGYARRALVVALGLVAVAALLQLLPVPNAWLAAISPRTVDALRELDPVFAAGLANVHAISLAPVHTGRAIALYGSFAVFLLGLTRLLSLTGSRRFAEVLTAVGVLVALAGIIQKPLYNGKLYGVWTPIEQGDPFGPFVNRNHFAGWMLMVLPITLGLLAAGLDRGMRGVKPDLRNRLLWLSSPDANRLILVAGAAIVMALSLVMTMSRSGITALALAVIVTGFYIVRADGARSRKVAGAAYLVVLALTVAGWVGVDTIAQRFSKTNATEFNNRRGAWADTIDVARAFPLLGTGLNTYGVATLIYQRHNLDKHYEQSHNDYLQLMAEGGALVAIPAAFCLALFVREVRRRLREGRGSSSWWIRAGAVTALVAIGLQELFDFSLQIPGNTALFAAVCALAIHEGASR